MKKTIFAAAALVIFGLAGTAQAENNFSGSVDVGVFSDYVYSTSGQTLHDHSVIQPSLLVNYDPWNVYAMVWSSYSPRGGFDSDLGDEVDWVFGIVREYGGVTLDLSYAYLDLVKQWESEGDLHAVVLHMDFPAVYGFNPYLKIEGNLPEDKDILDGGLMWRAGASYDLKTDKVVPGVFGDNTITLDASLAGHDGAFGTEPEFVSSAKLSFFTTYNFEKFSITPEINFQKQLDKNIDEGGMTEDKVWLGVTMSVPFNF